MPSYHLELGSEGHSFHGKAIVVNSRTGQHHSHTPIPLEKAEAQMRLMKEKEENDRHEDYKGPRNKDGTPKKSAKAWDVYMRERSGMPGERAAYPSAISSNMFGPKKEIPEPKMMKTKHEAQREDIPEREEEGVKEVKAKEELPKYNFDSPRTRAIYVLSDWIYNSPRFIVAEFEKQTGKDGKSYLFYIDNMSKEFSTVWNTIKILKDGGVLYKGVYLGFGRAEDEKDDKFGHDIFSVMFEEEETALRASYWLQEFAAHIIPIVIGKRGRGKLLTEEMFGTKKEEESAEEMPEAPAAKKDALAEFVQTAPEDITGVDYGAKNKEGKLQQGVITKMLGRESLDIAKNIIVSCLGGEKRQSYARLCGAITFLEHIARGDMNYFSDVKANTYDTYHLGCMKKEKEPLLDIEEDPAYRAANMCIRILANHEKSLIQAYPNPDPKRLTRPIAVYRLLPTSKTVALIDAQMPKGFNSNVGHVSGMGHARDNYKWQIDTSGMNLKTKAGKEARDAKVDECKRVAKGLLDSLLANLKEGAYLYLDKGHKAQEEEKATEKAKGAAAFEIPQGEKKAVKVFLTEDILRSIILAITGDPKKASAKVEEYRAEGHLGKQALVYRSNRGNKNVKIEFVKE